MRKHCSDACGIHFRQRIEEGFSLHPFSAADVIHRRKCIEKVFHVVYSASSVPLFRSIGGVVPEPETPTTLRTTSYQGCPAGLHPSVICVYRFDFVEYVYAVFV